MKIVVLCGGNSPEREVSLNSGSEVEAGLRDAGFEVILEDIHSIRDFLKKWPSLNADGVFIALHGGWGEDGRIQAALEANKIPFTGSGAKSCMFSMDKETTREVLGLWGVPTPPGFAVTPDRNHDLSTAVKNWGKIVIKPASGGSTVGVVITDNPLEARDALTDVWDIDTKAIVEKFIPGRELTAAVFGTGKSAFAMPLIEIRPASGFYDYKSKYTKGATDYICPAELDAETTEKITGYAVKAHEILGCRRYSRVDFRLTPDGKPFALEVNTAPGMTATSLVPKAASAYGWTFPQLLSEIVKDLF
ncbi:MAG: D-alanine--D-alanine ligase [Synergistaceae bacterium]|jgi:D-alanine-D-alanine ligase|nr:D-alanine--D-alanine ligase [Synergistaceae bacterium]